MAEINVVAATNVVGAQANAKATFDTHLDLNFILPFHFKDVRFETIWSYSLIKKSANLFGVIYIEFCKDPCQVKLLGSECQTSGSYDKRVKQETKKTTPKLVFSEIPGLRLAADRAVSILFWVVSRGRSKNMEARRLNAIAQEST
jgi:hypothetical protein